VTVRILGIDPGSRRTGWALIAQAGRQLSVIESGVIRLGEKEELGARLGGLLEALETILDGALPTEVAVEDVFAAKNARSALALGQARGVVLAAAGRRRLPLHAYPPATVKRAVCGHGRAEKEQVQRMVTALLTLRVPPLEDEADAMAIAICHALMRRAPLPPPPPRARPPRTRSRATVAR
jgi:crossover junction endodeoxyribonuclease RuvC